MGPNKVDHGLKPLPCLEAGENEGFGSTHPSGILVHDLQGSTDQGGQVSLVDNKQVRFGNARSAFAGDLVTGGDVDHVKGKVGKIGAEGGTEVVTTTRL